MADHGLLGPQEIERALGELGGWKREGKAIVKLFDLRSFKAALAFVNTVGELAERADHHPDILVEYSKVTLRLTSHDAGGVTQRDLRLARQVDAAFGDQRA